MSELLEDGGGTEQSTSSPPSPLHTMADTEDSVFTAVWDGHASDKEGSLRTVGQCDGEGSDQFLQYDPYSDVPPSPRDVDPFQLSTSSDLKAALQTEKEFLHFVSSLPLTQTVNKDGVSAPSDEPSKPTVVALSKPAPTVTSTSHVGLNHLDNLCKMIEQLKELREQNNRLQKRVHYLEDVKALQDMHNEMSVQEQSNFSQMVLANLNLSESELRLEEIPESPLFSRDSDESLDSFISGKKIEVKDELLDLPPGTIQIRSSSDDDSRRTESTEAPNTVGKEKKMPKTTWGKVKNIINYNKKETVRKKPQSLDPPSRKRARVPRAMSTTSPKLSPKAYREPTAISDPEEYDLDCEPYDGDGSSWDLDGEGEAAGIWINPKKTDFPPEYFFGKENIPRGRRKKKPHLTITVPSCEDVSLHNVITAEPLTYREGIGKISPESTGSSKDRKHSPNYSTTPPSPRRTSHWSKVKQAFLTGHNQTVAGRQTQKAKPTDSYASAPNSPGKRPDPTSFNFDAAILKSGDAEDGFSSELSPSLSIEKSRVDDSSPTTHGLQKNLMDLQKTLTGEFTKKLCEWEKLKKTTGQDYSLGQRPPTEVCHGLPQPENIPFQFRKKMDDWDKAKLKERDKAGLSMTSVLQKDLKTKNYEEETLPPEFKKKLTEWQIRKALVGKFEHNVEEIQKNLGEDFNKKLAEWERMKAQAKETVESDMGEVSLNRCRQPLGPQREALSGRAKNRAGFPVGAKLTSLAGAAAVGAGSFVLQSSLDRKGSGQKLKKGKIKEDKLTSVKSENIPKTRNKELQWLEKELGKIDREKQRLEREKEKFMEREARLEKMRYAMKERQPETKEIYIKTSTGEFRFEGISQTFTKKLYEWEERRGIRPESSTFLLLDPNYKAPGETVVEDKPKTPEPKRIVKSRSESSLAERAIASIHSNASTASLNEEKDDGHALQIDSKAASEPTLPTDESLLERQVIGILAPKEDFSVSMAPETAPPPDEFHPEEGNAAATELTQQYSPPYAPDEITRLIDSSESEERYHFVENDGIWGSGLRKHSYVHRTDSVKSEEDYRYLLHENMTLLGQLKEKENVCRAIETQMGDLDNKMDTVADQHIRTLERLHRQVNIMRKSESFGNPPAGESYFEESESERNRVLITQLKSRIAELEEKGDRLMADKEDLECAFNLHKEQETQIAESLLLRIRELQEAGAEVNIQTVQCQTDDLEINESHETSDENKGSHDSHDLGVSVKKKRRRRREEAKSEQRCLIDDESEEEHVPHRRSNKDQKDGRRKRRPPPRNVQKLHNLTADLLFQAKRLEQGIIAKHNLCESGHKKVRRHDSLDKHIIRHRSLKSQRSLRIPMKDTEGSWSAKAAKFGGGASKTWSSIEAIGTEKVSDQWENKASAILIESQDLLKMNSDLTRMARELRKEMTNIWSFKDSTSESNSSDSRIGHLDSRMDKNITKLEKEDAKLAEEETWLAKQATEVFKSIASLQSEKTLWPSSRELSLDEGAVKLTLCSTADEFNIPENQSHEFWNSDERSNSTQPEENNRVQRIGSSLSDKNPIEREGTFLEDNFCFIEESATQLEPASQLDQQKYEYEAHSNLFCGFDRADNQDYRPILGNISEQEKAIETRTQFSPRLKLNDIDSSVVVHKARRYRFPKILPYETEVNQVFIRHNRPGNGLRTRRVSDSQIDYSNFNGGPKLQKNPTQKSVSSTLRTKASNKGSFRRNQSANDVPLLQTGDTPAVDSNIFVPTNRTVFTVIDNAGCVSQVKKSIIENKGASEKYRLKIDDHEMNLDDSHSIKRDNKETEIEKNIDCNIIDSTSDMENVCERVRRYNDPVLNRDQQVKLLNGLHEKSGNEKDPLQSSQSVYNPSTPLCYKSFPRRNGHSADNSRSKGFKAVIDIFNNRITRNQQLLMNPFAMGDPFIEVKRRQALSSDYIDVINSEENVEAIYLGLHLHRDKTPGQSVSRSEIQERNPLMIKNSSATFQKNKKNSLHESMNLEEAALNCRKLQLKKAKDEFFQEMLNSEESPSVTDQITLGSDEASEENKLRQQESPPNECRSVACQKDPMSFGKKRSTGEWSPEKPPRTSLCEVDLRTDGNTHQKADRNSLLANLANSKISKSIMKIFKKEKSPERRSQSAVAVLCRHSLNVNVNRVDTPPGRNSASDQVPHSSRQRVASETHAGDHTETTRYHTSTTLPRGGCTSTTSTSSNSCPPTPYVQQKSRSISWYERSLKMLKGKAQSPEKKSR